MFSAVLRVLHIKDLKDLEFFCRRGYYRHAGPKGPEEMSVLRDGLGHAGDRGGQAPALR